MNLIDVNLKDISLNNELKTIVFNVGANGEFEDYFKFIKELYDRRRLNIVKDIEISRTLEGSSESAQLKINFQLEGYYL